MCLKNLSRWVTTTYSRTTEENGRTTGGVFQIRTTGETERTFGHECVVMVDAGVLMGPSCSSLEVFSTQGFYAPSPCGCYDGVSVRWTYATLGFACTTAVFLAAVILLTIVLIYKKYKTNPEVQPLLAN